MGTTGSLIAAFGLGFGLGALVRLWWARVHSPRVVPVGAAWLALLAPQGLFIALAVLRAWPLLAQGHMPHVSLEEPIDLLVGAVLLGWALSAGAWRDPGPALAMLTLALLPWGPVVLLRILAAAPLNPSLSPTGNWNIEVNEAIRLFLALLGARLALSGTDTPSEPEPLPQADLDGVVLYQMEIRSSMVSYLWGFVSLFLVLPGVVLFLRPELRGLPVTVKIWGEAVEIEDGKRTRLSMAGGRVQLAYDLFGSPVIDLVGSDGAYALPAGAVPSHLVDDLVARLQAATLAPEAPVHPTPEALRKLQGRAVEGT